ncbi:hypothetical protein VCBJG01_1686 [Vibrio cholerae BJG-01]|nr:hypothetical protein VCBJG01_1686 [Vibrio cholerae BJG-01]
MYSLLSVICMATNSDLSLFLGVWLDCGIFSRRLFLDLA